MNNKFVFTGAAQHCSDLPFIISEPSRHQIKGVIVVTAIHYVFTGVIIKNVIAGLTI